MIYFTNFKATLQTVGEGFKVSITQSEFLLQYYKVFISNRV